MDKLGEASLRFSEPAGPCISAERAGRLNEDPGLSEGFRICCLQDWIGVEAGN